MATYRLRRRPHRPVGPGHRPFTSVTRVRIPLGSPVVTSFSKFEAQRKHKACDDRRMGSTINRGTRDRPRWVGCYKDADGRWKQRPLKGAETKAQARQLLAAIEKRVMEGR